MRLPHEEITEKPIGEVMCPGLTSTHHNARAPRYDAVGRPGLEHVCYASGLSSKLQKQSKTCITQRGSPKARVRPSQRP